MALKWFYCFWCDSLGFVRKKAPCRDCIKTSMLSKASEFASRRKVEMHEDNQEKKDNKDRNC
jgi:hypothetical protein